MAIHPYSRKRKAPRRNSWKTYFPFGVLVIVALAFFASPFQGLTNNDPGVVKRVVDGDTIVLENNEWVRLIGVDTPETKHPNKPVERFGKEAAAFTQRLAEGKRVRLEFDNANAHLNHKDRYERRLAYVFLPDGTLLNAEIIRQGYGFAFTRYPFARIEEFRRLEHEAREQQRGLWRSH